MIVINARFLTQQTRGVQRFAEQISLELASLRDDLVFVTPANITRHETAERLNARVIGHNRGHLWEQLDLPLWLLRNGRPPLVSLCNTAPLAYANQIVTHHDITYVRYPESYSRAFRLLYCNIMPLLLRRTRALMTVSEFSREEISAHYGYPFDKISIVPNAVAEAFRPFCASGCHEPTPYLLAVSSHNAHKNFARMVNAFLSLQGFDDVQLHIVGDAHGVFAGLNADLAQHPRIRLLGRLTDEELVEQYQGATAFVFPSLYEGFGIPPLEAQACDCPVIAANSASIPEVLGRSALYFDPLNLSSMALAMRRILENAELRNDLRALGRANVARFAWKSSALKVSDLIDQVLTGKRSPRQLVGLSATRH